LKVKRAETMVRCTVAPRRATWQEAGMTNGSSTKSPLSGGVLLAISLLLGFGIGVSQGQASLGTVIGFGVGMVLLTTVWLIDRRR
jgi:hypothetical protein